MPNEKGGSVDGPLSDAGACHCSQCRRMTGHFFAAATCAKADLAFESDETLAWYASSPGVGRGFCSRCGSSLFWHRDDEDRIDILAGSLDAPTGLVMTDHIFVADKGDYYEITDGLPQYAQWSSDK
jgi:hypothetical protein